MRFTITYPAGDDERFASDAFDSNIGKRIRIRVDEGLVTERVESGLLVKAEVAADGRRVALTFDGPSDLLGSG